MDRRISCMNCIYWVRQHQSGEGYCMGLPPEYNSFGETHFIDYEGHRPTTRDIWFCSLFMNKYGQSVRDILNQS